MAEINDKIEQFIGVGREHVLQIMSLHCEKDSLHSLSEYKKLLIAALIDRFSKSIYPRIGHRQRYVRFLRQFADWKDCDRLSLTHLSALMRKLPDPEFQEIREEAMKRIATWTKSPVPITNDPFVSEVIKKWPQKKDYKEPSSDVSIDSLCHASLFYTYRCSLAHELMAPGFSWDAIDEDYPYYIHGSDNFDKEWKERWLLVYPLHFFKSIADSCLRSLEKYLKHNQLDPYETQTFGEYWLESLKGD